MWEQLSEFDQKLLTLLAEDYTAIEIARQIPKKGDLQQRYSEDYIAHKFSALYKKIGVKGKAGAVDWYHKNCPAAPKNENPTSITTVVSPAPLQTMTTPMSDPVQVQPAWSPLTTRALVSVQTADLLFVFLLLWTLYGLTIVGFMFYTRITQGSWVQEMAFGLDLYIPLLTGIYGLLKGRQRARVAAADCAIFRTFFAVALGALFFGWGDLLVMVDEWGNYSFVHYDGFDLTDWIGYLPSSWCLLAMVYWLGQAQWHVGPVVPAATGLVSTITTHKRRAGLHALAQSYTWGIYLAFTLMFIALFGAWEVYYNRNLNKLFFDLYYPLLDLFCLQCLVVLQLRSSALNTEYSYRLAIHYLLLSLFALLLGDTLYALTTSLPDTHAFAYEQNPNWIDFIFSTAFILRGIALFYAHTQHSG